MNEELNSEEKVQKWKKCWIGDDMEWIDREKNFPDCEWILCWAKGKDAFICKLLESKWGNHYFSMDYRDQKTSGSSEWTHWQPLPQPPTD